MNKHVKITNRQSLGELVDAVVKESMKAALYKNGITEKERQNSLIGEEEEDLFDTNGSGKKPEDDVADKEGKKSPPKDEEVPEPEDDVEKSSSTISDEMEKLKNSEVTSKDVIDKLNVIRAARSFKDSSISGPLDQYVNSLTKTERVALLAFLKGLSQICSGEIPADKAVDPSDPEPDVEMQKGGDTKKVTVKPTIVKNPTKGTKRPSGEDTKGPASSTPITPKVK
jgi:hypothetical protein